jgi:hypothetical protein
MNVLPLLLSSSLSSPPPPPPPPPPVVPTLITGYDPLNLHPIHPSSSVIHLSTLPYDHDASSFLFNIE